ncbi:MAG TPA: lipoate--protein ligase [Bacteroidales bacterium]|nr:lipoate--protein ligase [Bacteroidales bacterium]HPS73796.1 lipoate--protein ligase [Bacteroidales bacterium]
MLIIRRNNTEPHFNLAAEEYFLKEFSDDIFMLWRNSPAIIVGKHQNTLAEINLDFVKDHNIQVVRRITGGGSVFHDLGNINFTFISNQHEGHDANFRRFTQPILDVLQKLGIPAQFEGRNDLTINGLKFSGNAQYIWKDRILHHGTLLFSAKMDHVSSALKVDPAKFTGKAVKSVRSRVTNISDHLKEPMDVEEFARLVELHIHETYPDAPFYELGEDDLRRINELVDTKYGTWEWNFGISPEYNLRKVVRTKHGGTIDFTMNVTDGIIQSIRIFGDYFSDKDTGVIEQALTGTPHQEQDVRKALEPYAIGEYFKRIETEEFINGLF